MHGAVLTEPLMGEFVRDDEGNPLLVLSGAHPLLEQQRSLPKVFFIIEGMEK